MSLFLVPQGNRGDHGSCAKYQQARRRSGESVLFLFFSFLKTSSHDWSCAYYSSNSLDQPQAIPRRVLLLAVAVAVAAVEAGAATVAVAAAMATAVARLLSASRHHKRITAASKILPLVRCRPSVQVRQGVLCVCPHFLKCTMQSLTCATYVTAHSSKEDLTAVAALKKPSSWDDEDDSGIAVAVQSKPRRASSRTPTSTSTAAVPISPSKADLPPPAPQTTLRGASPAMSVSSTSATAGSAAGASASGSRPSSVTPTLSTAGARSPSPAIGGGSAKGRTADAPSGDDFFATFGV